MYLCLNQNYFSLIFVVQNIQMCWASSKVSMNQPMWVYICAFVYIYVCVYVYYHSSVAEKFSFMILVCCWSLRYQAYKQNRCRASCLHAIRTISTASKKRKEKLDTERETRNGIHFKYIGIASGRLPIYRTACSVFFLYLALINNMCNLLFCVKIDGSFIQF